MSQLLPSQLVNLVKYAGKLPAPAVRVMIRRALAGISPADKLDLWNQVKDIDITVLEAMTPEQWPPEVPADTRAGVLVMLAQVQTILGKECAS